MYVTAERDKTKVFSDTDLFVKAMLVITGLLLLNGGCAEVTEERHPNVILIIIDTLCADHLSCYDYYRNTSPVIDSLASEGIMYARMQAQAPWTLPAMVKIYTGLTERSHGCNDFGNCSRGLDPELPTIATILHDEGFNTAGFVNINYLGQLYGMDKGFDCFLINDEGHGRAAETVDEFISWLDSEEFSKPFFVVFHLFDPHLPYDPPMGYDRTFSDYGTMGITQWIHDENGEVDPAQKDHLRNLYDGEIRWVDSQLSRMFRAIREKRIADNTLIIFTADHGEEFLEHGECGHSQNLYQQSIHVPLILSGPGIPEGIVDSMPVGQFDILPTVLTYLQMPVPERIEGMDILSGDIPDNREIPSSGVRSDSIQVALLVGAEKVIWSPVNNYSEMFNIVNDPDEMMHLEVDSVLLSEVLDYGAWPCLWNPTDYELGAMELRRLEDLGYIR